MSDAFTSLVKEHHAFYEVLPYYLVIEERHGSFPPKSRRVQAGFDVDVYGVNVKADLEFPEGVPDYVLGYNTLQNIAEEISQGTSGSCFLEVTPFPSKIVFDNQNQAVEGMLRIRISHRRGLDQPAGQPEQQALEQFEKQLRGKGLARR
jgi:hypothetical protein